MNDLFHDLRFAFRSWRRSPLQILLILLTLALGVGINTAVFSYVHALLLRPLPFPESDRLVRIYSVHGSEAGKLMPREWEELLQRKDVFSDAAAWYPSQYNLTSDGPPQSVPVAMTTGNLFALLGARVVQGVAWPLDYYRNRHAAVVLSHSLWQTRFGSDPSIVGRSIEMDASLYDVVGVAEAGFDFPVDSGLYRSANLMSDQNRTVRSVAVVARLARGVSLQRAQSELDGLAAILTVRYPDTNRGVRFQVSALRDAYVGEARPFLLLTLALAAVVLLIGCANVVNILFARAVWRRQEMAMRAALGASNGRLARQLLTESVVLGVAGGLPGVGCALLALPSIRTLLGGDLPGWMRITLDWPVLLFALGVSIAAGLLAGMAPALAALEDPGRLLQQGIRLSAGTGQSRLRAVLIAGEIALAFALLTGASLLVNSFRATLQGNSGFSAANLVTFRCDPPWATYNNVTSTARFYRDAISRLERLPGVLAVAANHSLPLAGNDNYGKPGVAVEGQSADEQQNNPFVNLQIVSPNYFQVMGIRLLSGRPFSPDDRETTAPVAILSRNLADRLFGPGKPPNRRIRLRGLLKGYEQNGASRGLEDGWFHVAGVVDKVRSETLVGPYSLDLYLCNQQQFAGDTYFVLKTELPAGALAAQIRQAIREVDFGQSVFDLRTMEERVEATIWQRRVAGVLGMVFGALAGLLAILGVYGVISYSVSRRGREIGIRLALGASRASVIRLIVGDGMKMAGAGLLAGIPCAAGLVVALRGMLERSLADPATVAAISAALLAAVFVACLIPGWRAATTPVTIVLKEE